MSASRMTSGLSGLRKAADRTSSVILTVFDIVGLASGTAIPYVQPYVHILVDVNPLSVNVGQFHTSFGLKIVGVAAMAPH